MRDAAGEKSIVRVRVPAPECPAADKPVEAFDDAARKSVIHALMAPESIEALKEGLRAEKLDERRQWWKLALSHVLPMAEGTGAAGAGGVKIIFDQRVPAPAHEEGPLSRTVDVTNGG